MKSSLLFQRITKALYLNINDLVSIYEIEAFPKSKEELRAMLQDEHSKRFKGASYEDLGIFLDGLITKNRGKSPNTPQEEQTLNNNLVLKKLRVALNLKSHEMVMLFALVDVDISPSQINALFRNETHKNYRLCSDKMLLDFLDGVEEFYYQGEE